jgi:dolichol-phosphate mannosyltransferase
MDCDFSMPLEAVPKLINALSENDIAIGSRYVEGGRDEREFSRVITSKFFNTFASLLLGRSLTDYTTGFVAAKRDVFDNLDIYGVYGEYCVIFLYNAKKQGFKIAEVPYACIPRNQGETKTAESILALLRHGRNYGMTVLKLWFK